jgi:hypothetical protein
MRFGILGRPRPGREVLARQCLPCRLMGRFRRRQMTEQLPGSAIARALRGVQVEISGLALHPLRFLPDPLEAEILDQPSGSAGCRSRRHGRGGSAGSPPRTGGDALRSVWSGACPPRQPSRRTSWPTGGSCCANGPHTIGRFAHRPLPMRSRARLLLGGARLLQRIIQLDQHRAHPRSPDRHDEHRNRFNQAFGGRSCAVRCPRTVTSAAETRTRIRGAPTQIASIIEVVKAWTRMDQGEPLVSAMLPWSSVRTPVRMAGSRWPEPLSPERAERLRRDGMAVREMGRRGRWPRRFT